ncbi:DUF3710 domain-containing protein [Nocardioides sp. CFH 31398]|uniref:DUF3710 domain-containing protein n=1 Tax=Nocardioides sp. CFH 31398 TaxID=2919579 RepID=UPI001F06D793|nr:DUF3710 domain-containing protein [Nocardioides sp. CFH 31398]MCH1866650.1 DUF3710 domain-containing protein [Nocardioides sp. CFH 31398]
MRFRRKDSSATTDEKAATGTTEAGTDDSAAGPFDVSEVDLKGTERVDLGSLLIAPWHGREVRVQVDEKTQAVRSVLVAAPDGAMELRAFAAPRNGDLWSEVRPQIAEDLTRRGGTASEREGRFGTELVCRMPVKRSDGTAAEQPSRVIGYNGARWLLRATLLGKPAVDAEEAKDWEDAFATVVVRRGTHAMPVGDPLPIVLPDSARRLG